MSKHNDPRFGEQTYRLTNIVRSEPDASLFTVPNGYKLITGTVRSVYDQHCSDEGCLGDRESDGCTGSETGCGSHKDEAVRFRFNECCKVQISSS
jgi:hypothetical protein